MKQYKLIFPEKTASEIAQWTYESGVQLLLSWRNDADFFATSQITAFFAVPGLKETEFADKYRKFIVIN